MSLAVWLGEDRKCSAAVVVLDLLLKLPSNSANSQLPCGSFRCGKNCPTCPYISNGLTTYTFFSTGETRPIKFNLTCETKNLIYVIQCNHCNLQYIGEAKRRLKDRFNEHRRTIDNPNNKSFYVVSTSASIFFILYVKPIRSLLIQRTPAGSSFRLFA